MADPQRNGLKICLAGSGGGHVRQLIDLKDAWIDRDHYFVTEDLALGRSLAEEHRAYFVPHFAFGQLKLGQKRAMVSGMLRNLVTSFRVAWRERPDVIISTGAAAAFFTALFGRMFGAKLVLIESYARFDAPSVFGRLSRPLATLTVVSSPAMKARWPDAHLFDPLKILDEPRPPKKPILFATVGATLAFPRMIDAVLAMKRRGEIPEHVVAQVGENALPNEAMEDVTFVPSLTFDEVQALLQDADIAICHGGTGSIITALRAGCRTVAMPRRFALGEHYDNHQEEVTGDLKRRGLIEVALDADELPACIARARENEPRLATTEPDELIAFLRTQLNAWDRPR